MTIDRLRSYSSAFSRNVFTSIILYSDFSQLDRLYGMYDYGGELSGTYLDYLSRLYKTLVRSYRCEYVYKNEIINQLLLKKYGTQNTVAFNEFKVGDSIVDFAIMNGESKAFEIKTSLDTPRRLRKQMFDYRKIFNKCYVVVEADKCDYYAEFLDDYTGIVALSYDRGYIRIEEFRPAKMLDAIDATTLMKCLRIVEYENIIRSYFGELPNVASYNMYGACLERMNEMDSFSLNQLFLCEIKKRRSATMRLKNVPKELRQMFLSLNLSHKNEKELIRKLNSKINSNRPCIIHI